MNLLIVGATGTLGRQIARQALDAGHEVRCMVRNPRKATFLREWGAEVVRGDICDPETLPEALEGIDAVIDAATARATDTAGTYAIDWTGKVNLIKASVRAQVQRFVFFSILYAEAFPDVPLMEIKRCTEQYLAESGLEYTILRPCGFMQGLIGQYAIPILDGQPVWVSGESTPIAYANSQDVAKFAVRALAVPETANRTFPIAGTRAWTAGEIVQLCERMSGKSARISRLPMGVLRAMVRITQFFQWTRNASERLMFAEVLASGKPLNAPMDEVYDVFGIDASEMNTLESYLQEYFGRILKKLKEIDYEKEKAKQKKKRKQRSPFKSKSK